MLDTCVLVPSRARDVLLEAASAGVYRPLRSSEILAELDRTLRLLQAKRGMAPEETDAVSLGVSRGFAIAADPDRPGEVVNAVRALASDPAKLKAMGEAARAAAPDYDRAKELHKFVEVFAQLTSR